MVSFFVFELTSLDMEGRMPPPHFQNSSKNLFHIEKAILSNFEYYFFFENQEFFLIFCAEKEYSMHSPLHALHHLRL